MRNFYYFLSFIFFVDCILLLGRRSITLGLAIMFLITGTLFSIAHFYPELVQITSFGLGRIIKNTIIVVLALYCAFVVYFLSFGKTNVTYNENVVIVLGCGLNTDGTPSETLKMRLDGAIEYLGKNPDAILVLSGGKSRNHPMTEAMGMKLYLLENGIDESKIILEERATNTRENFKFSKEILKENNIATDKIVYITNSFHTFRAGRYADEEGFDSINHISVKTDFVVFIPAVLRESCAVMAMLLFNY